MAFHCVLGVDAKFEGFLSKNCDLKVILEFLERSANK